MTLIVGEVLDLATPLGDEVRRLIRFGRWAYTLSRWRLLRPLLRLFR
ncbi:MAG TPA: hypothetical protein VNE39_23740 [Planctomycetota bacterium]|nr:hypothetical protein [Planctomycetota bacterium]